MVLERLMSVAGWRRRNIQVHPIKKLGAGRAAQASVAIKAGSGRFRKVRDHELLDERFALGGDECSEGDFECRSPARLAFAVEMHKTIAVLVPELWVLGMV